MTPETIDARETKFLANLTDSSGKKFTTKPPIDIGGGFSILPIQPAYKSYYYPNATEKKQICLHFTVGVITGDIASLTKENTHTSVQYVVDRQGHIYSLFDDSFWSYHLGATAVGGNSVMSKQSIGIEISNYGPLRCKDGKFIDAYGSTYTADKNYVDEIKYRGYEYYAKMSEEQKTAVARLLIYLSEKHNIPLTFKENTGTVFSTPAEAVAFRGIFCHTDVRSDKFDLPPEMTEQIKDAVSAIQSPTDIQVDPYEDPIEKPTDEPVHGSGGDSDWKPDEITEPVQVQETVKPSVLTKLFKIVFSLFRRS